MKEKKRGPYHIIEDKLIALPRTPSIYGHLVWKKSNVAHRLAKREGRNQYHSICVRHCWHSCKRARARTRMSDLKKIEDSDIKHTFRPHETQHTIWRLWRRLHFCHQRAAELRLPVPSIERERQEERKESEREREREKERERHNACVCERERPHAQRYALILIQNYTK